MLPTDRGNCPSKLVFMSTHPFSSRDCIDKKPHICISSFSESSLSYSPLDSCVDLDGLSGHDRPRVVKCHLEPMVNIYYHLVVVL
jgi:hypothetical protein